MTKYRKVERTTKGGSIKQHFDIDWIYYASVEVNGIFYSTTTRTLHEAEEWIEKTRYENFSKRAPKSKKKSI